MPLMRMRAAPSVLELDTGLRLRPLTPGDADDVFAYSSDPEFCRHLAATPPSSVSESEAFIAAILSDTSAGRRIYWGIECKGRIVGTIGFLNPDTETESLEIGFGIARLLWGSGTVNRCMSALVEVGCKAIGARRLLIGTAVDNRRAAGFARKSGFQEIGLRNGRLFFELECG